MDRKLAAILAADVVGFAGMMARDEQGTLTHLEHLMDQVIRIQVEANRGRIFKTLGDGILAEFSSTVEALNCAEGIQQTLALEQAKSGDALQLRIGISAGDVVIQGEDLMGDGINTAARLQAMADPGGIAATADVVNQARGKTEIVFKDFGFKKLKDTDEPVHVFKTGEYASEQKGIFDFGEDLKPALVATGSCLCGEIELEVSLPPLSTGYCHCRICQKFTGSAMSTWTAFPASGVRFKGKEPKYHASSPIAERGFCPTCGSSLSYRLVKPKPAGYLVLFTSCLDNPEKFAPAVHGGIESKMPWLDILDDFPRTTCAESRVLQEAWRSVGLSNPQDWRAKAEKEGSQ